MSPSAPIQFRARMAEVFVENTTVNTGSFRIAPTEQITVTARKIKHKHIRKESTLPLPLITSLWPPLGGPVARNNLTPCHMGRGLAGHPRSVRLGSGDNKMRLYTSIRSKISVIWRHGLHIGPAQQHSRPACQSDEFAGKRSCGNGFPSSDRARLLQPLLPHPQEGWWILVPILDIRHLNRALMKWPFRMITSKQILLRICSGDWIFLLDLKGTYFLIHIAPPHQGILEIRLPRSGLSIHGHPLWAVPGSPHFYEVHGCRSFASETDGNPHPELPRRLAHFGPVGGRASISSSIVPENSYRLSPNKGGCHARMYTVHSAACGFIQNRSPSPSQSISKDAGPHGLSVFGTSAEPASRFSTGWNLEILHTLGVTDASMSKWTRPALQLWPLGKTFSGWNGACPWVWPTEGRWSQQMLPTYCRLGALRGGKPLSVSFGLWNETSSLRRTEWFDAPSCGHFWPLDGSLWSFPRVC